MAAVALPLMHVTKGSAEHAIVFGTGNTGGIGGSVIWQLGLHGLPLLLLSRIMPIVLAALITWAVGRRLGPRAFEPVVMLSLIAVSLSLRLVFEQQIFEYYFMALSVALVLLDVVRGHIRGSLVAWILTVTSVYLGEIDTVGRDGHFLTGTRPDRPGGYCAADPAGRSLPESGRMDRTPGRHPGGVDRAPSPGPADRLGLADPARRLGCRTGRRPAPGRAAPARARRTPPPRCGRPLRTSSKGYRAA